jgi:ribosomal protein S12 methylthiotransferase
VKSLLKSVKSQKIEMRTKSIDKTIITAKPRVNVVTLGCSKNTYDSEILMGQLKGNMFDVVHESDRVGKNDIVVINTCGFIDNAKQESIDTILQYSQLKEQGKVGKVIVTGCLSERYKPELEAEIPTLIITLVLMICKIYCSQSVQIINMSYWANAF